MNSVCPFSGASCLSDRATLLRKYLFSYLFIVLGVQGKFAIAKPMEDRRIATTFLMSGSKDYLRSSTLIAVFCQRCTSYGRKRRVLQCSDRNIRLRQRCVIHRPACWMKADSITLLYIYIYIYIYILTAVGLTPGGSSTVHIYTPSVHRIQRTEHT
jgi:hypothetical protein